MGWAEDSTWACTVESNLMKEEAEKRELSQTKIADSDGVKWYTG